MEQNNQIENRHSCFCMVIGNTTYVVHVHFSETTKVTLEEKIKRLIREENRKIIGITGKIL
ncbi:MAG: transposon-encoded TnpW family protein [Clostridia bacterium]|nr:transposon-encoded TnpW family protein [Clostridia bacterium]